MDDQFKVSQLTKELVSAELKAAPKPGLLAARTIRKTVEVALKSMPAGDPCRGAVITEAVRGGLQGIILVNLDPAEAGIETLRELSHMAQDLALDPTETLLAAMQGMALLKRLMGADQMERLRIAIEGEYHGAGEAFGALLAQAPDPGARARAL